MENPDNTKHSGKRPEPQAACVLQVLRARRDQLDKAIKNIETNPDVLNTARLLADLNVKP